MCCEDAKKILKEIFNKDVQCCYTCHAEAEEGYNSFLEAGTEPCCTLITELAKHDVDAWYDV
jgi:hypothetical protein